MRRSQNWYIMDINRIQREENERIHEAWQEEPRRYRETQEVLLAREERKKKSDGKIQAIVDTFIDKDK